MKKLAISLAFMAACFACAVQPAAAVDPSQAIVVATCGTPPYTYYPNANVPLTQDTTGKLCDGGGGAGSSNATIVAPLGSQTSAASVATTINGSLPAGTAIVGKVGIDQTTPGTTNGVQTLSGSTTAVTQATAANLNATVVETSSTAVSSSSLEANHVIVSGAGKLTSFQVSADSTLSGAAWWIMIYNATSAPGDGAVTPVKCYSLPSGATGFNGSFDAPVSFSTGIVIGVSTTGCLTKTASAHAFISGDFQ